MAEWIFYWAPILKDQPEDVLWPHPRLPATAQVVPPPLCLNMCSDFYQSLPTLSSQKTGDRTVKYQQLS